MIILENNNPLFTTNQWFLDLGFPWVWEVAMTVRISAASVCREFVHPHHAQLGRGHELTFSNEMWTQRCLVLWSRSVMRLLMFSMPAFSSAAKPVSQTGAALSLS